jgi:hypothetical protein
MKNTRPAGCSIHNKHLEEAFEKEDDCRSSLNPFRFDVLDQRWSAPGMLHVQLALSRIWRRRLRTYPANSFPMRKGAGPFEGFERLRVLANPFSTREGARLISSTFRSLLLGELPHTARNYVNCSRQIKRDEGTI